MFIKLDNKLININKINYIEIHECDDELTNFDIHMVDDITTIFLPKDKAKDLIYYFTTLSF